MARRRRIVKNLNSCCVGSSRLWRMTVLLLFCTVALEPVLAQQPLVEKAPLRSRLDREWQPPAASDPIPVYPDDNSESIGRQGPLDASQLPDNRSFERNGYQTQPADPTYREPLDERGRYRASSRREPFFEYADPYPDSPYDDQRYSEPDFRYDSFDLPQQEWGYPDPRTPRYSDERQIYRGDDGYVQDDVYPDQEQDPYYAAPHNFVPSEEWQRKHPVFRVGVITGANHEQRLRKIVPLRRHLLGRLRVLVEFVPLNDLNDVIRALESGRVDYVPMSASAYARAWLRCECVEPLVVPRAEDGTDGYYAILVARKDSGVEGLADLKKKRLALLSPRSTTGFQLPMAAFEKADISVPDTFQIVGAARTASVGLRAVEAGDYDVAASWSSLSGDAQNGYSRGPLRELVTTGDISMADLRIVWQSEKIPHGPHVIRKDLPVELKERLLAIMLDLETENPAAYEAAEPRFSGGFAGISHDAYAPLVELAERRGNATSARSSLVVIGGE